MRSNPKSMIVSTLSYAFRAYASPTSDCAPAASIAYQSPVAAAAA